MEKRQEYRLTGEEIVWILHESSAGSQLLICDCLDLSANGLMVELDSVLPVNSVQQVCVQLPRSTRRFVLTVEVRWSEPQGDHFLHGLSIYESEATDVSDWKATMAARLEGIDD